MSSQQSVLQDRATGLYLKSFSKDDISLTPNKALAKLYAGVSSAHTAAAAVVDMWAYSHFSFRVVTL